LEFGYEPAILGSQSHAKNGLLKFSLGVIPGYGEQRLPQLIGRGRAMEMISTGGMIDAAKALELRFGTMWLNRSI